MAKVNVNGINIELRKKLSDDAKYLDNKGWINAKLGLPPNGHRVLCFSFGKIMIGQLQDDAWVSDAIPVDVISIVTYWMDLPDYPDY